MEQRIRKIETPLSCWNHGAFFGCGGPQPPRPSFDRNPGLIRFNPQIYRENLVHPGRVACQDIPMMPRAPAPAKHCGPFSNRVVSVKLFLWRCCSPSFGPVELLALPVKDAAVGVLLLFAIGAGSIVMSIRAVCGMGSEDEAALSPVRPLGVSDGRGQRSARTRLILRPHGDIFCRCGSSRGFLSLAFRFRQRLWRRFRRRLWRRRRPGSSGTRCHLSTCGAGSRRAGAPAQPWPVPCRAASPPAWPRP